MGLAELTGEGPREAVGEGFHLRKCYTCDEGYLVPVSGLSSVGNILICTKKDCNNSIFSHCEKQIPRTTAHKACEEVDIMDLHLQLKLVLSIEMEKHGSR